MSATPAADGRPSKLALSVSPPDAEGDLLTTSQRLAASPRGEVQSSCARRTFGWLLIATYLCGLGFCGWLINRLVTIPSTNSDYAFFVAGVFVFLAVPLSLHDINMHMLHYVDPLQNQCMRLIWMVPIYSIQSWLALVYHDSAIFLETARECYEAYALYSFLSLMLGALGGKARLAATLAAEKERARCMFPFCYFPTLTSVRYCVGWRMGTRFVHRIQVGVYQYVAIRVFISIVTLITAAFHVYGHSWTNWSEFYPYASIVINGSQMVALWCLALFYMETHDLLGKGGLRPLAKFFVIKAVVFLSWWQGLGIQSANAAGLIPATASYSKSEMGAALQNFAMCVELFFVAIMHHYFYSYTDFWSVKPEQKPPLMRMREMWAEADAAMAAAASEEGKGDEMLGGGGMGSPKSVGGGGSSRGIELTPASPQVSLGYAAAAIGMLPLDVLSESADYVRTGFGLTHKWEKRRKQQREVLHNWAEAQWAAQGGVPVSNSAVALGAVPIVPPLHPATGEPRSAPNPVLHHTVPLVEGHAAVSSARSHHSSVAAAFVASDFASSRRTLPAVEGRGVGEEGAGGEGTTPRSSRRTLVSPPPVSFEASGEEGEGGVGVTPRTSRRALVPPTEGGGRTASSRRNLASSTIGEESAPGPRSSRRGGSRAEGE